MLEYIYKESVHGDLLTELGITLWRVVASFVVAMFIAFLAYYWILVYHIGFLSALSTRLFLG